LTFRPYPGLTIASVIAFAILCGLGFWQLERLQWKLALIETVNRNMAAPPLTLEQALTSDPQAIQYRRITLSGVFDNALESYSFATSAGGEGLYHVLTPFTTDDGHMLLVDRGVVPESKLDPATRKEGDPPGETEVTGVWRIPDPPGAFTPPPDTARRIWYARDVPAIAAARGITLAVPVLIEADATPNPGGLPLGGQTVVSFRNLHLGYALTWFGFAACLIGVWLAYHIQKGRLAWGKR
jgi:surfeit locus 1 family protein